MEKAMEITDIDINVARQPFNQELYPYLEMTKELIRTQRALKDATKNTPDELQVAWKVIKLRQKRNETILFHSFEDADDYFQECETPVIMTKEDKITGYRIGTTIIE